MANNYLDTKKLEKIFEVLRKEPYAQVIGNMATAANVSYIEAMLFYLQTTAKYNKLTNLLQPNKDGEVLRLCNNKDEVYYHLVDGYSIKRRGAISDDILAQFALTDEGNEFIELLLEVEHV